jgi:DMSO/TMAO reductase YedYZ molybdopterin-dependent catalytic subunit
MIARLSMMGALLLLVLSMSACGSTSGSGSIVAPTLPATIPDQNEVDPATGLHVTGTPVVLDLDDYRLKVHGKVDRELALSYEDILDMPKTTATLTIVCSQAMFVVFADTATWSGVPLKTVLETAGLQTGATEITMKAADDFFATISLEVALNPENLLAYELEGEILPVLHGFPLRAVIPHELGSNSVKWLTEIVVD